MEDFNSEKNIEAKLRKHNWLIPVLSFFVAGLLFSGICLCLILFQLNYYWTILPAGLMVHAFFIVLVHDGAHKAITRTKWDSLIMNAGAGLMLLPFYAEPFRRYHLIHHANTNSETDPLWSPIKKKLFQRSRPLYVLCELVPLIFTFIILLNGKNNNSVQHKSENVKQIPFRIPYLIFSFLISALLLFYALPPLWFVIGTLFSVNIVKLVRHWCEHMGTEKNKESNTYWFPLGMGIGNHEAHHHHPHYSWLTMAIGLYSRKKDTNAFKTFYGILFKKTFVHYPEINLEGEK